MSEICTDNRFEIIAKAKEALLDSTNIDTSPDEMACLDSFLFRCWQMGWLDKYDNSKDIVEVRHGKPKVVKRKQWVDDYKNLDGTLFECSKVLVEYEEEFCPFCGKALGDFDSYCGNCGAKMDGEEQEHEFFKK